MVPPTCGAALLTKSTPSFDDRCSRMKRRPGNCRDPLRQIALDEHGLAVENVDLGIDVLAVHQERHVDLFHALQHAHDLAVVGDAGGRVGGGVGGIELHPGEHAVLEAALDVVGIGVVGEVAGDQRPEGRARRQRRHDALAIGDAVLGGGDRRNQVRHQDGAAEMPGRVRQHRLEHGAVAHMQVPVVGLADGERRGHLNRSAPPLPHRSRRRLVEDHRAGEVGDAGEAAPFAPLFQPVDDRDHAGRIAEGEIADHHRAGAGQHVLDHVLDLDDAAAADDRDLHRLRALVDHAQDDRLDAGPGKSAVAVADRWPEGLGVDLEARAMVLEIVNASAPAFFGRLRDQVDLAGIGRELGPERLVGRTAYAAHDLVGVVLVQGKIAAARLARRARDVHLDHVDFRQVDVARHGLEIVGRRRGDVGDERWGEPLVVGNLMVEEIVEALGRQPDRVDHAAFDFGHARRRIAVAMPARHGLAHERAEPVDIHHLRKVGRECARCRHDRVLERHAPDPHAHVYHPTASCRSNTGPSMQTRRSSFLPSTSKVRTQT